MVIVAICTYYHMLNEDEQVRTNINQSIFDYDPFTSFPYSFDSSDILKDCSLLEPSSVSGSARWRRLARHELSQRCVLRIASTAPLTVQTVSPTASSSCDKCRRAGCYRRSPQLHKVSGASLPRPHESNMRTCAATADSNGEIVVDSSTRMVILG